MAKTLKFNLVFGGKQIRTLEDLKENFFIQDVFPYFQNGLLTKWLNLQGLTEYVEKLEKIDSSDKYNTIKELINIFLGDDAPSAIIEFSEILRIEDENRKAIQEYVKGKKSHDKCIEDYFLRYDELVNSLMEEVDLSVIKPIVKELVENFMPILELSFRSLFNKLHDAKAFYPICHMLTYEFFRENWLIFGNNSNSDLKVIYDKLVALSNSITGRITDIPDYLCRSNKSQDGSWEEIEFPVNDKGGKRCMVLSVNSSASVRAYKDKDCEYRGSEVVNAFEFFDGLDYRHTNSTQYLVYIEV